MGFPDLSSFLEGLDEHKNQVRNQDRGWAGSDFHRRHHADSPIFGTSPTLEPIAQRDFFVNETTLRPESHSPQEVPPLRGGSVVIAVYYGFHNSSERKLGYLKKYTPQAKQSIEEAISSTPSGHPVSPEIWIKYANDVLVRKPDPGSPWVLINSPEGKKVVEPPVNSAGIPGTPLLP